MGTVFVVEESAEVRAPIERVFALSTQVDLVSKTLGMRAVGGVTSGHVTEGSRVVWRGWKFGLPTEHYTLITGFRAPYVSGDEEKSAWFEDSQEKGRFASFRHQHFFAERAGVAMLRDEVKFSLPFGVLGSLVARWVLVPHVRRLCRERFALLKRLAEEQ